MSVYDAYGETRLKLNGSWCNQYNQGDKVEIPDGVYYAISDYYCRQELGKAVVISNGIFIGEFQSFDIYGDSIDEVMLVGFIQKDIETARSLLQKCGFEVKKKES